MATCTRLGDNAQICHTQTVPAGDDSRTSGSSYAWLTLCLPLTHASVGCGVVHASVGFVSTPL
eukprot:m.362424 g.362424  ORF g.362424 m.362424 type:complete len:63 (-) comp20478_c0_seq1:1783-1971(-)